MDFELLSETPQKPPHLIELLERLITNRKRHWQIWGANPPYILGLILLLTVCLELTVSRRLIHGLGAGATVIPHFITTLSLFLFFEMLFVYISAKGAALVGKQGSMLAALTYLNLSLTPLLLILPVSLLSWATGQTSFEMIRFIIIIAMGIKVISLWKQAMEHVYQLTPVQSALVLYSMFGIVFILVGFIFYLSLIRSVTELVSG